MLLKSTSIADGAIMSLTLTIPSANISGGVFPPTVSPVFPLEAGVFAVFLNKSKMFKAISNYSSMIAGFTTAVL